MSYGGVKYSLFKSIFNHINSKRGHSSVKRTLQAFLWKKKNLLSWQLYSKRQHIVQGTEVDLRSLEVFLLPPFSPLCI